MGFRFEKLETQGAFYKPNIVRARDDRRLVLERVR
jgi:hypothetical protein